MSKNFQYSFGISVELFIKMAKGCLVFNKKRIFAT